MSGDLMNQRTSGVIIAVSSAVAGSLLPSAVQTYLDGKTFSAYGLGAIVALNACIALLHIMDRRTVLPEGRAGEIVTNPREIGTPVLNADHRPAA